MIKQLPFRQQFRISSVMFCFTTFLLVKADVCPSGLKCENRQCCVRSNNEQYCCSAADDDFIYFAPVSVWWRDHWGLVIGLLIAGIIISIIVSILCCLFCNGCCWCCGRRWGPRPRDAGLAIPIDVFLHPSSPAPAYTYQQTRRYNDLSPTDSDYSSWDRVTHHEASENRPKSILKR